MSYPDRTVSQNLAIKCTDIGKIVAKPVTIGEYLDQQITDARKRVEKLCVIKAKLEALNVLDHEVDLYTEIIFG